MICKSCKNKDHNSCIEENKGKQPSACDCQHRVDGKKQVVVPTTIVHIPIVE